MIYTEQTILFPRRFLKDNHTIFISFSLIKEISIALTLGSDASYFFLFLYQVSMAVHLDCSRPLLIVKTSFIYVPSSMAFPLVQFSDIF